MTVSHHPILQPEDAKMNKTQSTELERKAYEAAANNARLVAYYAKRIALEQRCKRQYRPAFKHRHLFSAGRVMGGINHGN